VGTSLATVSCWPTAGKAPYFCSALVDPWESGLPPAVTRSRYQVGPRQHTNGKVFGRAYVGREGRQDVSIYPPADTLFPFLNMLRNSIPFIFVQRQ
jgi:hypothetical protein